MQPEQTAQPTDEQIFARREDLEAESAGANHDADNPLTAELVAWADVIFVMEKVHRSKLQRRFRAALGGTRVICLDVPGDYDFMQPELVRLREIKVSCQLPAMSVTRESEARLPGSTSRVSCLSTGLTNGRVGS